MIFEEQTIGELMAQGIADADCAFCCFVKPANMQGFGMAPSEAKAVTAREAAILLPYANLFCPKNSK